MPSAAAICALAIGVASVVELGVGEIAQIADRRRAVARQHVERIGEIAAAVLATGSGAVPTKLRSRSSASLNAVSGTAKPRSRARVRKSVT